MVEPGFDTVDAAFLRWKAAVNALREIEQRPSASPDEIERLRREEELLLEQATLTLRSSICGRR
jgi:hypothetical protein